LKTEAEKLVDVEGLFQFILKIQDKVASQVVSAQEAKEGSGRKGILIIKCEEDDRKWNMAFEVINGRLVPTDNLTEVRTGLVFENVGIFLKVVKELLAGNTTAFSRARARGDLKVMGDYAIRDAVIFNELLSKIGRVLVEYNVKIGD
jgi:hypothetical protein